MHSLKEKVSEKLSRFFADSPNSSSQASLYSRQGKSFSSYFSDIIPSSGFNSSMTSKDEHYYTPLQSVSATYNDEKFELQDDTFDTYVDCSPVCTSKDIMKDKINDEDQASRRSSGSPEVFKEGNVQDTPHASKTPQMNLADDSFFISPELYEFLDSSLPNIVKGCQWVLLYSTSKHGISLRTLIRKSAELSGPGLLIVGDKQGAVFGGLLECPLKPTAKRKYQGTSQSFVFTTKNGESRLFRPTGANRFYLLCLSDLLALGGGGSFALCLDGDLLSGTSGPCDTYGNLCLAHSPEFELKNVELWGFTHGSPYLMQQ